MHKIVGDQGVFATRISGMVTALTNADSAARKGTPIGDNTSHNDAVRQYFVQAGLPADQIESVQDFEVVSASASSDGAANPQRTVQLVGLAIISFQQRNYSDAVRNAALAVDLGGGVKARVILGDAHFRLCQYREAANAYREALKIDPTNLSAENGLALATKRSSGLLVDLTLTSAGCRKPVATESDACSPGANAGPSTAEGKRLLDDGQRLLREERFAEASEIFRTLAGSKHDRGPALVGLAMISFQEKDYDDAVRKAALAVDSGGGVRARVLLGDAHFRLGHYKEAAKAYSEALKIDPNNPSAKNGLALATKRI